MSSTCSGSSFPSIPLRRCCTSPSYSVADVSSFVAPLFSLFIVTLSIAFFTAGFIAFSPYFFRLVSFFCVPFPHSASGLSVIPIFLSYCCILYSILHCCIRCWFLYCTAALPFFHPLMSLFNVLLFRSSLLARAVIPIRFHSHYVFPPLLHSTSSSTPPLWFLSSLTTITAHHSLFPMAGRRSKSSLHTLQSHNSLPFALQLPLLLRHPFSR